MSNALKDTNLELLMGLKHHLDQATKLRALLDRLLSLAASPAVDNLTGGQEHHEVKQGDRPGGANAPRS